jgi:hypothetical protein
MAQPELTMLLHGKCHATCESLYKMGTRLFPHSQNVGILFFSGELIDSIERLVFLKMKGGNKFYH